MKKKGFTFIVVFFIALLGAIFFMIYTQRDIAFGESALTRQEQQMRKDYLGSYGELLKNINQQSLRYAGFKGAFKSAEHGTGLESVEYWMVYGKRGPPQVTGARDSLGLLSKGFMNKYLQGIDNYDFGKLRYETNDIGIVRVMAEEKQVMEENAMDEGFYIAGFEGKQFISAGSEKRAIENGYFSSVYPLRYWYMYRILRTWVNDIQSIPEETCFSLDSSQTLSALTIKTIVNRDVNQLKEMFDDNVACGFEIECVNSGSTPLYMGGHYLPLIVIEQPPDTRIEKCLINPYPQVCRPTKEVKGEKQILPTEDIIGYAPGAEFVVNVTCRDYKYEIPIENPSKDLVFNIRLHVSILGTSKPPAQIAEKPPEQSEGNGEQG